MKQRYGVEYIYFAGAEFLGTVDYRCASDYSQLFRNCFYVPLNCGYFGRHIVKHGFNHATIGVF